MSHSQQKLFNKINKECLNEQSVSIIIPTALEYFVINFPSCRCAKISFVKLDLSSDIFVNTVLQIERKVFK